MIGLALTLLLLVSNGNVIVSSGVMTAVPTGYVVSNLDPNFGSAYNNEIYDPNFLPGFDAGLTNTAVQWNSGMGYGNLSYSIGPWTHEEGAGIPHFAVGPQCCNFVEVPHTQQFRRVEWGDYYYVRAGLGAPGINTENYTAVFGGPPTYVGLRTDWDWKVQLALRWANPVMMNSSNEWGAIGIDVTQVVPNAPGKLVYTLMNLWMDSNSSSVFVSSSREGRWTGGSNLVTYHPVQVESDGNETLTVDISPYLTDTLQALGLGQTQNQPPVIAYVYLNVEGYNFEWNSTLWSFNLMTTGAGPSTQAMLLVPIFVSIGVAVPVVMYLISRRRLSLTESSSLSKESSQGRICLIQY